MANGIVGMSFLVAERSKNSKQLLVILTSVVHAFILLDGVSRFRSFLALLKYFLGW